MGADVLLTIPSEARFVQVIRTTVAAIASRLGFTYEAIEDVRLAVDEASTQLLALAVEQIQVAVFTEGGGITIDLQAEAAPLEWPPASFELSPSSQILDALLDEVSFSRSNSYVSIRLLKKAPE